MSEVVKLSGTPLEMKAKLIRIKAHIAMRRLYGWEPFHDEEEVWDYRLDESKRNCPVCQGYYYQQLIDGDQIRRELPYARLTEKFMAAPETHMANPDYNNGEYGKNLGDFPCYCHMEMLFPAATLAQRLKRELDEV